jgi:hypothetical protein
MEYAHQALPNVDLVAVSASALVMLLVTQFWYSASGFSKAWTRHTSVRSSDFSKKETRRVTLISLVLALLTAYLLALTAAHAGENRHLIFLGTGFIWLFIALDHVHAGLKRRDSLALSVLHAFRSLATLMAGSAVFYFWS